MSTNHRRCLSPAAAAAAVSRTKQSVERSSVWQCMAVQGIHPDGKEGRKASKEGCNYVYSLLQVELVGYNETKTRTVVCGPIIRGAAHLMYARCCWVVCAVLSDVSKVSCYQRHQGYVVVRGIKGGIIYNVTTCVKSIRPPEVSKV